MKFTELDLPGAFVIEREDMRDERGFFARTFCHREFAQHGIDFDIQQSNISWTTRRGTIRGMHYQSPPHSEIKLVSCLKGAIFDCIIDLRPDSPTHGKHTAVELRELDKMLYVPQGFAHGFQSLIDNTVIHYLVSAAYAPNAENGLRWNDPALKINWPITSAITISPKDASWPLLPQAAHASQTNKNSPEEE